MGKSADREDEARPFGWKDCHFRTGRAVTDAAATARMPRPGPCDLAGALLPRIVQRAYELVGFGIGSGWQVISHLALALRGGSLPVSR
jgi:hypothetical protein